MSRKTFTSLGALLRHYQVQEYWRKGDRIAVYRYFRFRWFAEMPTGGYVSTGRVTGTAADAEHVRIGPC